MHTGPDFHDWQASPRRKGLAALAGYLLFFLALFAQFPLQDALPGNTDTFMAILWGKTQAAALASALGWAAPFTAMYPITNAMAYGETAVGMGALYVGLTSLGLNDVFAYYAFISLLYALSAFAVYVFAGQFIHSFAARLFAGFAFTCSNVALAHVDEFYALFYFLPLLSLTYLVRAFREDSPRRLTLAAVLGGLQVYFSAYVFIYQTILLALIGLYLWARYRRFSVGAVAQSAVVYGLVAAPLVLYYSLNKLDLNIASPFHPEVLPMLMSLTYHDFFQALPGNLLYGKAGMPLTWDRLRHQNFIGFLVSASALYALVRRRGEHRAVLGLMALAGLLLATGPMLMAGAPTTEIVPTEQFYAAFLQSAKAPAPLYPFYSKIPLMAFHRVPVRAYVLVLLAVAILAAMTLEFVLRHIGRTRAAALLIVTLFFGVQILENVPFPMRAYKLGPNLRIPDEYAAFLKGKKDLLLLDLPTNLGMAYLNWDYDKFADPKAFVRANPAAPKLEVVDHSSSALSDRDFYHYTREGFYMNWQFEHRQNIVGGANGYFPVSRLIYDRWIQDLPGEAAIGWLRRQGISYIVYHYGLLLPGETDVLPDLMQSPLLHVVFAGKQIVVFEFAAPDA